MDIEAAALICPFQIIYQQPRATMRRYLLHDSLRGGNFRRIFSSLFIYVLQLPWALPAASFNCAQKAAGSFGPKCVSMNFECAKMLHFS
jgi:hypothetical protein